VRGCLVGRMLGDKLSFRYSQREREGGIHGGHSTCVLETLPDGRVRIHEHFTWATRAGRAQHFRASERRSNVDRKR
jgi:hypothetical protein